MSDSARRIAGRKNAYAFIWTEASKFSWTPPLDSDEAIASVLDVYLEELVSLKEGRADPTPRLIKGVRQFLKDEAADEEIEAYFVTPFR